jgi:hypothetical protein
MKFFSCPVFFFFEVLLCRLFGVHPRNLMTMEALVEAGGEEQKQKRSERMQEMSEHTQEMLEHTQEMWGRT